MEDNRIAGMAARGDIRRKWRSLGGMSASCVIRRGVTPVYVEGVVYFNSVAPHGGRRKASNDDSVGVARHRTCHPSVSSTTSPRHS